MVFSFPAETAVVFAVSLLIAAQGFFRFVFFISTGYGFSVAGMAIVALVLYRESIVPLALMQALLLGVYGTRLGLYLAFRETSPSYRKTMQSGEYTGLAPAVPVRVIVWISVALLYTTMFLPCLLTLEQVRATGGAIGNPLLTAAGVTVMAAGIAMEAIADFQKGRFKKRHPDTFCSTGLYGIVRCPNYFGEILFWTGTWVGGIGAYTAWQHWVASGISFTCIVLIMIGSTRRLEANRGKRYANDPAYAAYAKKTPVLFPFVPVYGLANWKVYLG
jgi:steroid 5-alpha reductase family enzyme